MLILKIHENEGSTPKVIKVGSFPCYIGRSLQNEVTIDHPQISAQHAVIEESDDGYVIRDLNSTNGIAVGISKLKELKIQENLTLWLGPLPMELIISELPLERTREFYYGGAREKVPGGGKLALKNIAGLAGILLASVFAFQVSSYSEKWTEVFLSALGWVFAAVFFAGVAAVFSKIHNKKYYFFRFLFPIQMAFMVFILYSSLEDTILFNLKYDWLRGAFQVVVSFSYLVFVSFQILRILFSGISPMRLLRNASLSVVALFLLSFVLRTLQENESQRFEFYGSVGYPMVGFSRPANPLKTVFEEVNKSFEKVQDYRRKVLEEKSQVSPLKNSKGS